MKKPSARCVGIDIAAATFTVTVLRSATGERLVIGAFEQTPEGFDTCIAALRKQGAYPHSTTIVMECTGVYGERLCHYLYHAGYFRLVVEAPAAIHRVFKPSLGKNDSVDSQQIAEYAWRFSDRLRFWKPKDEAIEDIDTYLALREDAVCERTAKKNRLKAFKRKQRLPEHAQQMIEQQILQLTDNIKDCEKRITALIEMHPELLKTYQLLTTIPGVKMLLAANLLVSSQGIPDTFNPRTLAKHLGIAPLEYQSGSSIYRTPRSAGYGNHRIRKLLRLAAQSLCTYRQQFQSYYKQKLAQGKAKSLILNNVSNKLVKIICAVSKNNQPYDPHFVSIKPNFINL